MKKIEYVSGDITSPHFDKNKQVIFIPHVCNNIGKFGAGVAKAISMKWPSVRHSYLDYFSAVVVNKGCLGKVDFCQAEEGIYIANMIAQNGIVSESNTKPIKYASLCQAMTAVRMRITNIIKPSFPDKNVSIIAPKFGAGLAGGNWDFIAELIEEIWIDHGIDVTIYEF